jgi:4-amino-4-deoxy-L-arabinose transferase-like glycosyltransferase
MESAAPGAARVRWKPAQLVVVALFAAGQALLWLAYYGNGAKRLIGDEQSYQDFALAILGGGTWMPSTIWPPLQSLFLASIYAIAGAHLLVVQLVQTLLIVGCAILLRAIWRRIGGRRAANVAAGLFLLNPSNAAYAQWLWPEVPHLFLVLIVFWLVLERPESRVASFVAGACAGLALLAKSLLAGFWPVFLLAFVRPAAPRFRFGSAAMFLVGIALATAPALWHGWREVGRPMIADSSLYNAWVGLTDRWRSDYIEDQGGITLPEFLASGTTPQERNAVYRHKVETLLDERGVASVAGDQLGRQYFRLFNAKTPLLSQLPGPACAGYLSAYAAAPWVANALTAASDAFHVATLVGFAFGIACWRRRPERALWLIGAYLAYQLALFGILHVKARFLFPMMPFLCAFAGSFFAAWRLRAGGIERDRMAFTPRRLIAGSLIAALLLVFAFGGPLLDPSCAR